MKIATVTSIIDKQYGQTGEVVEETEHTVVVRFRDGRRLMYGKSAVRITEKN